MAEEKKVEEILSETDESSVEVTDKIEAQFDEFLSAVDADEDVRFPQESQDLQETKAAILRGPVRSPAEQQKEQRPACPRLRPLSAYGIIEYLGDSQTELSPESGRPWGRQRLDCPGSSQLRSKPEYRLAAGSALRLRHTQADCW